MKYLTAIIATLFLFAVDAGAQRSATWWAQTFGGEDHDCGRSVRQTSDGGFIIAGETSSFGLGGYDAYLVRTDAAGDTLWTRTYGGAGNDYAQNVRPTQDGGFIFVGRTTSFGGGGYDVYLVKTDSLGNVEWSNTYGGAFSDYGNAVIQTPTGRYVVVGKTSSFGAGGYDVYLLRINTDGAEVWSHTYGGVNTDVGHDIRRTMDGGYIITGYTTSFGAGLKDFWLLKTSISGDSLWSRTFGGADDDCGESVRPTQDGGYILSGFTESFGNGLQDAWLISTDSEGVEIWDQTYGGAGNESAEGVQQTADGGFIVGGFTSSFDAQGQDVWVFKTTSLGTQLWARLIGGADNDYGRSIEALDDGFIIAGETSSFGSGGTDMYVIRLGSAVAIDLTPETTPIVLPARGGSFRYQAAVTNISVDSFNGDFWTFVLDPDSVYRGPFNDSTLELAPGATALLDLEQAISGLSPPGEYTLIARAGTYPNGITASTELTFTKLEPPENPITLTVTPLDTPIVIPARGGSYDYEVAIHNNTDFPITGELWVDLLTPEDSLSGPFHQSGMTLDSLETFVTAFHDSSYGYQPPGIYTVYVRVGSYPDDIIAGEQFQFEKSPPPANPVTLTVTPLDTPIVIPARGGAYDYNVEVLNNIELPITGELWVDLLTPEDSLMGPFHQTAITLDPLGAFATAFHDSSYGYQPSGIYTVNVRVGTYPDDIIAEEQFQFEKLSPPSVVVSITLTPTNPPIVIPPEGGTFSFDVELVNNVTVVAQGRVWMEAVTPNGVTVETYNQPVEIPPEGTILTTIEQDVPFYAPSGTYTYTGFVGHYPEDVLDTDSFTFSKSAGLRTSGYDDWAASAMESDGLSSAAAAVLPGSFALESVYPNPFNGAVTAEVAIPETGSLELRIFNVLGRETVSLHQPRISPGYHHFVFNAAGWASGVYIVRASFNGHETASRKVVLLR